MNEAKDLMKQPPRSPYERIGGFAIIARTIDKCRATIAGTNGEYHFDCPLDNLLFSFAGVSGDSFREYVAQGHTDDEIAKWVKENGTLRTDDEIEAWSDAFRSDFSYTTHPEKKEWFWAECKRLGLDPETTTLFDMLEVDDKVSFS